MVGLTLALAGVVLGAIGDARAEGVGYPWLERRAPAPSIGERFAPPADAERIALAPASFGAWLRGLPLLAGRPEVLLFDGTPKRDQETHAAVVDLDVGRRDLQQCADAVMRLRAEWQWASGQRERVAFHFTSGDLAAWPAWRAGERPLVVGSDVRWTKRAAADGSYAAFRSYLETVFRYAGSASLVGELEPVPRRRDGVPGDVFIEGGHPGHAVLVVDAADDRTSGRRYLLLAQSYMPAQQVHVLRNPRRADPWYPTDEPGPLVTPEWVFPPDALRRFP